MRTVAVIVGWLLLSCAGADPGADPPRRGPPDPTDPATARAARPVAGFAGYYHAGRLDLAVVLPDGRAVQAATDTALTTQSSGSSGGTTAAPGTVLLHQTVMVSAATRDAACAAAPFGDGGIPSPFVGVCTTILAVNGFAQYVLNPYVQLTSLAPCGTTTSVVSYVKDASSATIGVDNSLGLWGYTQADTTALLYPAGDPMARDRAARSWYFATDQPGALACFRFVAVVMGQPWTP